MRTVKWLHHQKTQKKDLHTTNNDLIAYNDLVIAYASGFKARLNYLYIIYR
jgi:hypothetical protein